ITLDVYPDDGLVAFGSLYEDDTISNGYQSGQCRTTAFSAAVDPVLKTVTVTIDPAQGSFAGALAQRSWTVRLRQPLNWDICHAVNSVMVDGFPVDFDMIARDQAAMPFAVTGPAADSDLIVIELPSGSVDQPRTVQVQFDTQWQGQNVGQTSAGGSFLRSQGQYAITGSGSGLELFQDSFYFVNNTVSGNCQIIARHLSTDTDAPVGVIWRQSLAEGAPFVALTLESGSLSFAYRSVAGLPAVTTLVADIIAEPLWLKVVRYDNDFNCFSSSDAINWTPAGVVAFAASDAANVGLYAGGNDAGDNALARFDNVAVIDTLSADIDGDGQIDIADLGLLVANWLNVECPANNWCERSDLNMDGIVDLSDISVLFNGYAN
ncbi:MAG: DUF5110 domain-containing protein, partial [Sedimentisphaerales bacterium]|nr:DUF5110 domain-containing protein [Sedimentisphaerales bacterium]